MKDSLLLILFFLFFCILLGCSKSKNAKEEVLPEAKIYHSVEDTKIIFKIEIPKDHHAYLDSGKENNLIPIQFDWQDLIQKQILKEEPKVLAKPKGEYDKEVQATVLRNIGEYAFQITNEEKEKIKNQIVQIKIQICNEVTGICFRPKIYKIQL